MQVVCGAGGSGSHALDCRRGYNSFPLQHPRDYQEDVTTREQAHGSDEVFNPLTHFLAPYPIILSFDFCFLAFTLVTASSIGWSAKQ